jgi:hypothetical protein
MRSFILLAALMVMAGCQRSDVVQPGDFGSRLLVLPNGQKIRCEENIRGADIIKGFMYREKIEPDRGMIFLHKPAGRYSYWTYQNKVPIDIIWIDQKGVIVEILANVPPCPAGTSSLQCPQYGGAFEAQLVLQLAGGEAAKNGLSVGTKLAI